MNPKMMMNDTTYRSASRGDFIRVENAAIEREFAS
jgi:hypothetical protein